jgi:uroporphyrinogen-III synthase
MSAKLPLSQCTILVTRPTHQAADFCERLHQAGAQCYRFPVIDIKPLELNTGQRELLATLAGVDIIVFISANAVTQAAAYLPQKKHFPETLKLAAIGNATAQAMAARSLPIHIKPEHHFDSESFLALSELQQLDGKHIVLVKGQGGRTILAETLKQRGAQLTLVDIYQRCVANSPATALLKDWQERNIDIQTITSVESLQNLLDIVGVEGERFVKNTPMVVISDRIKDYALERQFNAPILVAKQASDAAMVKAVIELKQSLA